MIKNEMLNIHQREGRQETKIKKLITSFHDKIEYGLNYRILQLYLKLGLKITKIHKVIEYDQDNFMEGYIIVIVVLNDCELYLKTFRQKFQMIVNS
jgi:hypothetical protein